MNEEKINEIIEKYYRTDEEYYGRYRYDGEDGETEVKMDNEIKEYLDSVSAVYKIEFQDGFSSCGYDNDFLAIAWLCNGEIKLETVLLECI